MSNEKTFLNIGIFNNPSNLLGRDGLVSALGSSIMEDLSVIYAKHGAIVVHGIFLDYSADGLEISMDRRVRWHIHIETPFIVHGTNNNNTVIFVCCCHRTKKKVS